MRLPRPTVPEGLAPPARAIMECLVVSAHAALPCHACCCLAASDRHGLSDESDPLEHSPQGLVEACTAWDPAARPSFRDILSALRSAAGAAEPSAPPTPASVVNPFQ